MNFRFKLARRMSRLRSAAAVVVASSLAACDAGPSPTDPDAPTSTRGGLIIAPDSTTLSPDQDFQFAANSDGELALKRAGNGRGHGRSGDSKPTLVSVSVNPDPTTLATGSVSAFKATGTLDDSSVIEVKVRWTATGGSIDSTGRYTAGRNTGRYWVAAASPDGLTDTAIVTVSSEAPTLREIVLTPASASISTGASYGFAVIGKMSDGSTAPVAVTWTASGGTVDAAGTYLAGEQPGTYRVVATLSGGSLADTASVTVTSPSSSPPPPTSGQTFFVADAESGNMNAWSLPWGVKGDGTNPAPTASQARTRSGGWAYRYEITAPQVNPHSTMTLSGNPQVSMGSPNGRYLSGYYSFWVYVDAGFTADTWNMLLGWMTGVTGAPSPISHLELRVWGGVLQLSYVLKNCAVGLYPCPDIAGYENRGGYYFQTAQSPGGIVAFPRQRWVHIAAHYKMSPQNGQVTVWQDGAKIMDLTAPSMNTFGGHSIEPLKNSAGDMMLQFGIYGGPKSDGTQRMYMDDFRVTDYRPAP